MNEPANRAAQPLPSDLRTFPRRALLIILCIFIAFVPLAYSPRGAQFEGLFDDFYYKPKLTVALYLLTFAAAFYLARMLAEKRLSFKYSPVFPYVAAFLAALTIATLLSPHPDIAFWGRKWRSEGLLAFLTYGGAFFLFATAVDSRRDAKTIIHAMLIGAGIASAYGLSQFFGFEWLPRDHKRIDWWRAFATSGNPGFLSAYLLLALPFPALFFLFPGRKNHHGLRALKRAAKHAASPLWLALAALIFTCILATYHRGAWVGLAAGAIIASVLLRKYARPYTSRILILVVALTACALFVDRSAASMGRPSLFARVAEGTGQKSVGTSTIHVRTYIWRATLPLIARRPAFGWGPDTMRDVFPEHAPKPAELGYSGRIGSQPDKPENLLLQVAYEGGLAALTPFVIAIGLFFVLTWRTVSFSHGDTETQRKTGGKNRGKFRSKNPKNDFVSLCASVPLWRGTRNEGLRIIAIGLIIAFASHLAQQQFSFSTLATGPVFWSLLGLGLAVARLSPSPAANRNPARNDNTA